MKTISMTKVALPLMALAALSGVVLASSNRNYELRESPTYFGSYSENCKYGPGNSILYPFSKMGEEERPFAIGKDRRGLNHQYPSSNRASPHCY